MRLSNSELILARQHPQSTELYLSVFQPQEVMRALVNDAAIVRGARTITYDNASGGGFAGIEAGMTLEVGTTPGGRDIGKIRIKSATSSTIVVSENSHILWVDNLYLTVLRYWEVFPIYPRIINDPNNLDDVIFYKDYDIAYSNQNSLLGAFPCAGNHRALFAGESSYWSSSGTTHLLGSALTYEWAFEGGTPTGSTSAVPGNVSYATPGHYVTRLKVTGANGTLDTTYRYVSVYNNPKNSSVNTPKQNWTMDSVNGSRGEGGYTANISIHEQDISLYDGDVVVLFADDWYGGTNQSLGGNSPNNSKIFYVGHVTGESIKYNYKTSTVSFQVASITDVMKNSEGFSVSVESKASPAKWFELLDMDGRRALYHYLKWHTTILYFNDFAFMGTDRKIQFFDSDRESMFDALDNYMRGTLLGSVSADRQGKIWAEVGAWAYSNPTGSFPPVMTVEKGDWMGDVQIEERLYPDVSSLELGGVAYSGITTGTFSALISNAPGTVPNFKGSAEAIQGLALLGQTQLNELAGNIYANKITRFPSVSLDMAGNYRNIDFAPQETLFINASAEETNINTAIRSPFLVDSVNWKYDSQKKVLLCSTKLKSLENGVPGETITIPDVPEAGGYAESGGNFNFGRISGFPPLLSSLLGVKVWQGSLTFTMQAGTIETATLKNYTDEQSLGGGGLMSANPTGTGGSGFPVFNETGYYLIFLDIRYSATNMTSASAGMSEPIVFFSRSPVSLVDGVQTFGFGGISAGSELQTYFSWVRGSPAPASPAQRARLVVVKLLPIT